MIDADIARVRTAAAELESAINAIEGVRVSIDLERIEVTKIEDAQQRHLWRLFVWVGGEMVRVHP